MIDKIAAQVVQNWIDTPLSDNKILVIIGKPGAGKSTLARVLAKQLNTQIVDYGYGGKPEELLNHLVAIAHTEHAVILDGWNRFGEMERHWLTKICKGQEIEYRKLYSDQTKVYTFKPTPIIITAYNDHFPPDFPCIKVHLPWIESKDREEAEEVEKQWQEVLLLSSLVNQGAGKVQLVTNDPQPNALYIIKTDGSIELGKALQNAINLQVWSTLAQAFGIYSRTIEESLKEGEVKDDEVAGDNPVL